MSKDIKFNFLNSDEEERYQKHLTLKEIGYEGQLDLKNSSCLLYTSPSPRDMRRSRMPSSA